MIKLPYKTKKIGELLVKKKLISAADLEEALALQKQYGSKVGEILVGEGRINHHKLYLAIAEHYKLKFVDLSQEPVDPAMLSGKERKNYSKLGVIPWQEKQGKVILATTDISREVVNWAKARYESYDFVITSPFDILWAIQSNFNNEDDEEARDSLWKENPKMSAKRLFGAPNPLYLLVFISLIAVVSMFFNASVSGLFIAINIFYVFALLFKTTIFIAGNAARKLQTPPDISLMDEKDLPKYSLLVPLFKEKEATILHLISSVRKLEYPKARLDVKLIVESSDEETIEIIKNMRCESYFEIIKTPFSYPQTKPKACNYALKFAKGEYVTIYDAEDVPDPLQLKKVINAFRTSDDPNLVCVQAKLNYYNRKENFLSRMFSLEYSAWFDFMLFGLRKFGMPIPLGGTSNHFSVSVLRDLHAWDPYNVTEDADLGMRLAQKGYSTAMVDSTTLEESPIGLRNWLRQRSRWIKGYMQTYIVHMRKPLELYKILGLKGFIGFLFFIGAPSLVFLTMPVMILISAIAFVKGDLLPDYFMQLALFNLISGVLVHVAFALAVALKNGWKDSFFDALVFPLYWVLHSIASFKALWQLVMRPHYWEKTDHGVTKITPEQVV